MRHNVVWKYALPDAVNHIQLPKGAQVLGIHMQGNDMCLWAMHDEDNQLLLEERMFVIVGTGRILNVPDEVVCTYIGSLYTEKQIYVFHVFEYGTKKG